LHVRVTAASRALYRSLIGRKFRLRDLRKVQRKVLITSGGLARAAVLSIIKKLYVSVKII